MTQEPPDPESASESAPQPPGRELPKYNALEDLPEIDPDRSLLSDEDLSWVDEPGLSDEEIERRRERREERRRKVHRRRRNKRLLKAAGVLFATFVVLFAFWFYWTFNGLERMPASAGQAGLDTPGTNILLVGVNPEEPDEQKIPGRGWPQAFAASDMVMVLHLTRDNDAMYVFSIPGDSLLPIPADGAQPAVQGKLEDAFRRGGQELYVKTVEQFTGAQMDRVAVLNLNALRDITDDVGGVIMDVPVAACNIPAGPRRFNGAQSLQYVALQKCFGGSDLDRVQRQQGLLRALMRGAIDNGSAANPFTISKLLKATASNLTLEKDFSYLSMFGQTFSMRGLRSSSTAFITVPYAEDPFAGGADTITLDPDKDAELWDAMRRDRVGEYLNLNKDVTVR
ncbi:LCP family protein required for cell wall assembly [Marmoricola sp. OAE513]|uniref:LCP family protein n=1 Tax=Marmoricola sp. OAE513 TaxID=2817894 RepID=UPI001AE506AF